MAVARFCEAFSKKACGRKQSSLPDGSRVGPTVRAADPTNVSGVPDALNQRRLAGIGGPDPGPDADDESGTDEALRTAATATVQSPGFDTAEGFHQPAGQPRARPVTRADPPVHPPLLLTGWSVDSTPGRVSRQSLRTSATSMV